MAFGGVFVDRALILAMYLCYNALHIENSTFVQGLDV